MVKEAAMLLTAMDCEPTAAVFGVGVPPLPARLKMSAKNSGCGLLMVTRAALATAGADGTKRWFTGMVGSPV